jgi:hypothetical protein
MNRPRLDAVALVAEMEYMRQELKVLEGHLDQGQIEEAKFTTANLLFGIQRLIFDCKVRRKAMVTMPSPQIGPT